MSVLWGNNAQGRTAETRVSFAEGASGVQNHGSALGLGACCTGTQSSDRPLGLELQGMGSWKDPSH